MKNIFSKYLLVFFILLVSFCRAASAADSSLQNEFKQAGEAYFNRDFNKAIELYSGLEKNGLVNSDLFYNLANANYRQGHIGEAIYYYSKALRYAPRDRDLVANYQYVLGKKVDQIEKPLLIKIYHTLFFWQDVLTLKEIMGVALLFYWAFFVLLALRVMKRKRGLSVALWISLVFNLIFLPTAFAKFYSERISKRGVVVASLGAVYSEPNSDSIKLYELHEGTQVEVENNTDKFAKIKLSDGRVGWIELAQVKTIPSFMP